MYRQFHCWWAFVLRLIPCCLVAAVPRPTKDQESGSIDWSLHQRTMSPLFTVFFVSPTPFSFIFFLFVTQCEMRRNGQHFPMIEDCSSIRRHHPYFSSLSLICLLMPFVFHFFSSIVFFTTASVQRAQPCVPRGREIAHRINRQYNVARISNLISVFFFVFFVFLF